MGETAAIGTQAPQVRLKGILLPTEHGSWGFLVEPLVASLAVAWSGAGAWIALLVVAGFLSRQPLKVYLGDVFAGRSLPQTSAARRFALIFIFIASIGFAGAVYNGRLAALLPFVFVAPFVAVQLYFDAKRQSRALLAEVIGAIAMSSSAAAIALAAGLGFEQALVLWSVFAARLVTSIIYVRNRLRAEKGKPFSALSSAVAHASAVVFVSWLALSGRSSSLVVAAFAILFIRAAVGLSSFRKPVKAMKIGIFEVVYGTLLVAAVIVGHYAGF